MPDRRHERMRNGVLLSGFGLACLIALALAGLWFSRIADEMRARTAQELLNALTQRSAALASEIHERIGDAQVFAGNPAVWRPLAASIDPDMRRAYASDLPRTIDETMKAYGYHSITVFGPDLVAIVPSQASVGAAERAALQQAIDLRGPVVSSLEAADAGRAFYGVAMPIFAQGDAAAAVLGAVYLEHDASVLVRAQLAAWPSSFHSLRLLFLREADDGVRFLTVDDAGSAAPTLRFGHVPGAINPLAAEVFASSTNRTIASTDARGVRVLGAVAPLPGVQWRLIAKIDQSEINAAITRLVGTTVAIVLTVIAIAGLCFTLLWHSEKRRRLLRVAVLSQYYLAAIRTMADGFLRVTGSGVIDEANDAVLAITGYSHDVLCGKSLALLGAPSAQSMAEMLRSRSLSGSSRRAMRWRCADGGIIDVDCTATFVPDDRGGYFFLVVRDITREHAARRQLERLNNLHHLLNHGHQVIQHQQDP